MYDKYRPAGGSIKEIPAGAFTDLIFLPAVFAVTLLFVYAPYPNHSLIRFALGLFSVLFVPGYLLIAAVYPRKDDVGNMERLVLAVMFSIIIVPMACLALNYTTGGIRLSTVLAVIALLTGGLTLAAYARRLTTPADRRFTVRLDGLYAGLKKYLLPASGRRCDIALSALLPLAFVLVLAAAACANFAWQDQLEQYTELYVCGPDGKLGNYPSVIAPGEPKPVVVMISNFEGSRKTYDLAVTFDDGVQPYDLHREQLAVDNNQIVKRTIFLEPSKPYHGRATITFSLYMDGNDQVPYHQCYLRVNATSPAASATLPENATTSRNASVTPIAPEHESGSEGYP